MAISFEKRGMRDTGHGDDSAVHETFAQGGAKLFLLLSLVMEDALARLPFGDACPPIARP